MEVLKCIQEILPELTRTQTKVAEYILVHPEEVCFLPLRMLAEKVGDRNDHIEFLQKDHLRKLCRTERSHACRYAGQVLLES